MYSEAHLGPLARVPMYFRVHRLVNSRLFDDFGSFPYLSRFKIYLGVTFGSSLMSRDMTSLVAIVTKTFFHKKNKIFYTIRKSIKNR